MLKRSLFLLCATLTSLLVLATAILSHLPSESLRIKEPDLLQTVIYQDTSDGETEQEEEPNQEETGDETNIDDEPSTDEGDGSSDEEGSETLLQQLQSGKTEITLSVDEIITETIYITDKITINVEKEVTLTRGADFKGNLFVIAENEQGKNSILFGRKSILTLRAHGGGVLIN